MFFNLSQIVGLKKIEIILLSEIKYVNARMERCTHYANFHFVQFLEQQLT